jgi:hypothetical protein
MCTYVQGQVHVRAKYSMSLIRHGAGRGTVQQSVGVSENDQTDRLTETKTIYKHIFNGEVYGILCINGRI